MNQLKDAIEKAKENENKLILIVGLPGSGKSKLIHEYSKDSGIPILDLDNIFKDTTNNIAEVMDNFLVTYNKDVLLLDNKKILYAKDSIEKAHPDVFNILLQVLDDGHITDAQGRKVDFKETIIIMTSNAGAQSIVEPKKLGFGAADSASADYKKMKDSVMEEVKRLFRPEFLNRIDDIIVFHMLNKEEIKKITGLLLKEFVTRCKVQMDIEVKVRDSVKELIAKEGFDPKYGARPLKRAIQNKIEDAMAEEILEGRVQAGNSVTIGLSKQTIKFMVNVQND